VRAKTDFFNPFNLICPVQSGAQKESVFWTPQISPTTPAILSRKRGVSRSSRTLGQGCGGRESAARAMRSQGGLSGSRERSRARKTSGAIAYGKAVWSWHPLLVSSWWWFSNPTGISTSR